MSFDNSETAPQHTPIEDDGIFLKPSNSDATLQLWSDIQAEHPYIKTHSEQLDCLDAIADARAEGAKAALIVLATGLGKTTIMAADARRFLEENRGSRIAFFAHNNDILAQARRRYEDLLGRSGLSFGNFSGDGRDFEAVDVMFSSFQTMARWREAFLRDEFQYVDVDEGHHGKAPTYEPTLNYFQPEFMLGATATPDRLDVKDIRDIFGPEIYSKTIEEAIAEGRLAFVDYHVITDEIAQNRILEDSAGEQYSLHDLDRRIFIPRRDQEIVNIIEAKSRDVPNPKRIVFCKSVRQVEHLQQFFPRATAIHSKLGRDEQKLRLQLLRDGRVNTVLVVDKFNEGVDLPDVNQIVFLRDTNSKTVFLQQLGRGLRLTDDKKTVQVLDFVANSERLLMVDRVWKNIVAKSAAQTDEDDPFEISVGRIQFNDSAKDVLHLLKSIMAETYLPGQTVPDGSVRDHTLARSMDISYAGLKAFATSVGIRPSVFPTKKGPAIVYYTADDASALKSALDVVRNDKKV